MRHILHAALAAAVLALAGCGGGGADANSQTNVKTTTKGQELQDLQKALESGAINQEEYEREKKKILSTD